MLIIFLLLSIIFLLLLLIFKVKKELSAKKNVAIKFKNCNERFKILFDIAPIFIDTFDEKGKCLLWNQKCENIFGWSIEEINAHENSMELFYPDPKDQAKMIEIFSNKNDTKFQKMSPIAKNGEIIHSSWANVNLPNGESIYIGIDIRKKLEVESELLLTQTQLKELNEGLKKRITLSTQEIQKKEQLLLQQSRLAQMGEMISMIAHQWRQPLSVIDMTAFDIQNKLSLKKFDLNNPKSQEAFLSFLKEGLDDIDKYTQYLTRTIEDFKNFFKPDKEKKLTTLDVPIDKAINILEPILKQEDVELSIDMQTTASLRVYTYELMQVILNILKNSIDNFIEKETSNRQINIKVTQKEDTFSIALEDNGGGIDEAILSKIFDPYFSTKTEKNGTGLGLYISKIVIENHSSGKLNVKNTKYGVCFEIILF